MPQHEPASAEEIQIRIDTILALKIKGFSQHEIVAYLSEKVDWAIPLSRRQLRNYCHKAELELSNIATSTSRQSLHALANMRYEQHYRIASAYNNSGDALRAQELIVKLNKLDDPTANYNWQDNAAQIGVDSPTAARLRDVAYKLMQLAAGAPTLFDELFAVIEEKHNERFTEIPALEAGVNQ